MPDDRLRPERVAKLTTAPPLPADLADLADLILDSSDQERAAAAAQLLDQTRQFLVDAGVLRPSVSIMDMSYRTAAAICATLGTVQSVWSQRAFQDRPLGDVLKIIDADQAAWVLALLRWGGLLSPE